MQSISLPPKINAGWHRWIGRLDKDVSRMRKHYFAENDLVFFRQFSHKSQMDKETALKNLLQRCFDARMHVYEICDMAGVSRATPSRWKAKPESIGVKSLEKLEAILDALESGKIKKGAQ